MEEWWRREAQEWVAHHSSMDVRLIGQEQRVEPIWLARRELLGRGQRRIAANNVSFVSGKGLRIVLLRSALHFLRDGEVQRLPGLPRGLALQVPIVRAAARRADLVVVPCTDMLERVLAATPDLRSRIRVRHHPVTVRCPRRVYTGSAYLLYPSLPASHKDLVGNLRFLLDAMRVADSPLQVRITTTEEPLGDLHRDPRVVVLGSQTLNGMDRLWAEAAAVYVPGEVESFGYPVAEARAIGLPVLAVDNAQNREIGADALVGYHSADVNSLANAIALAVVHDLTPDPTPFDPDAYFRWLVSTSIP